MLFAALSFIFRIVDRVRRKSNLYAAFSNGLHVGEGTKFVGSQHFGSEPYLVKIGNDCLITDDVKFITHDGGIQVPMIAQGLLFDEVYSNCSVFAPITIGNNVFIGMSTVLLLGADVADNTVIAAGSVVKGSFPPNVVIGGVPAKIICTLDEYRFKNANNLLNFEKGKDRKSQILGFLSEKLTK